MQGTGIATTSASTSSTVGPQGGAGRESKRERQRGVCDQYNENIPRDKTTKQISGCNEEGATEKARSSAVTASITLQCNFRMHLAAKVMLGAMTREYSMKIVLLQAAVRGRLRHIDWLRRGRRKDYVTEAASMTAARAALKYNGERQTVASRVEDNMHPLSYAIQLKRKRAAQKFERTTLIQSKFRRAHAAFSLQACVRARLQASQGAKVIEQGLCNKLSFVLQACCRRYGPRKIHRDTIASVSLQAVMRRRRSIQTFCARKAVLGASSHAQAALSRPRRKYAQTVAGLLIAAYLRACVVREKWQTVDGSALRKTPTKRETKTDALDKERIETQRLAVEYIQASIRRLMQRKVGDDQMQNTRETDSCCLLQAAYRRQCALRENARLLACKKEMAETARKRLSHFDKASGARRRHARLRGASVQLQASLRRSLGQSSGTSHMQESREQFSCQCFQATCRRSVAREAHKKNLAARTIHAAMLRRTASEASRRDKEACATLKRFFKAATPCRKYAEKQIAVRLQTASRSCQDRKQQVKAALRRRLGQLHDQSVMEDSKRESTAEHRDSVCGRMLARDAYFKDIAARTMQAAIRRRHAQTFSCSSLEQYINATLNQKQYEDKRSASGCLQSAFRRHKGQGDGLSQMEKIRQASSAQSLEAACRRTLAHEAHRRLLAVQTLKEAVRRCHDRLVGQENREAHATLEHIFRAALARQKYSVKRCAAVTLQTGLQRKNGQTEGQSHMDVSRRERAAQTLQAQCRRLLTTQNRDAVHCTCETLTRSARSAVVVRSGYEDQRAAATTQAVIRAHSGRHEGQGQMEAFATESLQAGCRRALAREMHMKGLMASTLQAAARRVLHAKAEDERRTQDEEERKRAEAGMRAKEEEDTRLEGELQENLQKLEKKIEEKKRAEEKTKQESQRKERERQKQEAERQRQQEKERQQAEKLAQQQEERMLRREVAWAKENAATAERALQEKEAGADKRKSEVNQKVIPTFHSRISTRRSGLSYQIPISGNLDWHLGHEMSKPDTHTHTHTRTNSRL
jgi:hypothetical protein